MPLVTVESVFKMVLMSSPCGLALHFNAGRRVDIDTNVRNRDWADAVKRMNMGGIRMLHAENPDLVNYCVTTTGYKAIHLAVQNKNSELLSYLLNNGANVNAVGGEQRNSALHEAVLLRDMKAVRHLFSYGIDDEILNAHNQKAINLVPKTLKREFTKAKTYRHKHREYMNQMANTRRHSSEDDVRIAGMSLKHTPTAQIRKYVKDTDHALNFYRNKKKEIDEREIAISKFGEEVGVDIDEIAMSLQRVPDSGNKLWDKWVNKSELSRQTEIYKVIYGLTILTLKQKNRKAKKPPKGPLKKLTSRLCKRLPKRGGRTTLTRVYFVYKMSGLLYELHDDWVAEEEANENSLRF